MSSYPSADDYAFALETARIGKHLAADRAPLLRAVSAGKIVTPKGARYAHVANGFFAYIYRVKTAQGEYALRCPRAHFPPDNAARLQCLSHFLLQNPHATYLVEADHFNQALYVSVGSQGSWFPVQVMVWVKGKTLLETVADMVDAGNAKGLGKLAEAWERLLIAMKTDGVVHGDLHPDNVIVAPDNSLRLVDYDTLIVPGFTPSGGLGGGMATYFHPGYARRQVGRPTVSYLDDFGALNILLSLQALASDPGLRTTSEFLLFSVDDIESPRTSRLFMTLAHHSDPQIARLADDFLEECSAPSETGTFRVENYLSVIPAPLPWHGNIPTTPPVSEQISASVSTPVLAPTPTIDLPTTRATGRKTWEFAEKDVPSSGAGVTEKGKRRTYELNEPDAPLPSSTTPVVRRTHPYDPK